jgi:hypothetical protein
MYHQVEIHVDALYSNYRVQDLTVAVLVVYNTLLRIWDLLRNKG